MTRVLMLTVDERLAEAVRRVCGQTGCELTVMPAIPPQDAAPRRFDLLVVDTRPSPDFLLTYPDIQPIMLDGTASVLADRALVLGHHEEYVGRMNTLLFGGSVYLRIPPYPDPPDPQIVPKLSAAMRDTLSLPPYRRVDFHDSFPDRSFYKSAVESIQVPIIILSSDAIIRLMNLRALARFNYQTQLVIDQSWEMLIAPSDRGSRAEAVLTRIRSGHFYEGTLRFVDRCGEEFPALITSSRVFSPEPESDLMIVLTIHDLTAMDSLQRQLSTFQRMESIERVISSMTHEFNNMLTAILGHAELLTMDLPEGSEAHDSARIIRQESVRAQELTGRLLGLSHSRQFMPTQVSCNDIVRETIMLMRHSLGERISIEAELLEGNDRVEGEPNQLGQVLLNLLLNARDAIEGPGTITVRTSEREVMPEECRVHHDWTPGIHVEIAVSDDGCGMTPEVMERVFEPFFTTKEAGAGTGLGLSVVRGIVLRHGGHLAIESEPGRGTTVMVRLPQSTATGKPAVSAGKELEDMPGPDGHGQTVLVVDDDRAVLIYAQKVLERAGYRVRLAMQGELAINLFDRHRDELDLIILDLTMPQVTGWDVLRHIRGRDSKVPVIVWTAFAPGGLDDELVEQVQGFIRKPFRPQELIEQITEVLEA
jgi:PAS domain S-box-containing protein